MDVRCVLLDSPWTFNMFSRAIDGFILNEFPLDFLLIFNGCSIASQRIVDGCSLNFRCILCSIDVTRILDVGLCGP